MSRNVLILGDESDAHAVHMQQAIAQTGATAHYWNTALFPKQVYLSWQPGTGWGNVGLPTGQGMDLSNIHSVYWRSFAGVQVPMLDDAQHYQVAWNDTMSALRSLIKGCTARWVNSWDAYQFHKEKPLQLHQVHALRVAIPDTLISNDPHQVQAFCRSHQRTIFKPVYGGAHTQFVTEAHLEPERLERALRISPITLQTYIPGTNVRSYVIGDQVYSAEIRSGSLDFREVADAELIPLALPEGVEQQCVAIARRLLLEWTAIDWRRTPEGQYVFLEANPSPMFLHFEQQTGFPITQGLVNLLLAS
jgi:glutathione synthase/RimK-type ligase-like ATP-grasp enzyme